MPEFTEKIDEEKLEMVSKEEYSNIIMENPGLRPMPANLQNNSKISKGGPIPNIESKFPIQKLDNVFIPKKR